jgi:hypothetical protein
VINLENYEKLILDFIHEETGYANPLEPRVSFEDLYIQEIKTQKDESISTSFKYIFDEDGFSMYDKRHILKGEIHFSKTKKILSWHLEETDTGVAAGLPPYKTKQK